MSQFTVNSLRGIIRYPLPRISETGTAIPAKSRTTSTCFDLTTSSRSTFMTSMLIRILSLLSLTYSPCSSACSGMENPSSNIHSLSGAIQAELSSLGPLRTSLRRSAHESGLSIPPLSQMHSTPIVPPPAVRTCKRDPASIPRRVVYPPRESCYKYVIFHVSVLRLIAFL